MFGKPILEILPASGMAAFTKPHPTPNVFGLLITDKDVVFRATYTLLSGPSCNDPMKGPSEPTT